MAILEEINEMAEEARRKTPVAREPLNNSPATLTELRGCYTGGTYFDQNGKEHKGCPHFLCSGWTEGNAAQCQYSNSVGLYGCPV